MTERPTPSRTDRATSTAAPDIREVDGHGPVGLEGPELYTNRELSWLDFNQRVLELAEDERLPLLDRTKFLAIYQTNLDEFFMVRVAGHHDRVDAGIDARDADGLGPSETIDAIAARVRELGPRHYGQWQHELQARARARGDPHRLLRRLRRA